MADIRSTLDAVGKIMGTKGEVTKFQNVINVQQFQVPLTDGQNRFRQLRQLLCTKETTALGVEFTIKSPLETIFRFKLPNEGYAIATKITKEHGGGLVASVENYDKNHNKTGKSSRMVITEDNTLTLLIPTEKNANPERNPQQIESPRNGLALELARTWLKHVNNQAGNEVFYIDHNANNKKALRQNLLPFVENELLNLETEGNPKEIQTYSSNKPNDIGFGYSDGGSSKIATAIRFRYGISRYEVNLSKIPEKPNWVVVKPEDKLFLLIRAEGDNIQPVADLERELPHREMPSIPRSEDESRRRREAIEFIKINLNNWKLSVNLQPVRHPKSGGNRFTTVDFWWSQNREKFFNQYNQNPQFKEAVNAVERIPGFTRKLNLEQRMRLCVAYKMSLDPARTSGQFFDLQMNAQETSESIMGRDLRAMDDVKLLLL